MSTISKPFTFSAGAVIVASEHNSCFDTIYNDYNGSITNANISASAAIVDTKLATISSTGKVNVSALTVTSQATGDILYASSATAWARLAVGGSTTLLHGGTTPAFSALVGADLPTGTAFNYQRGTIATVVTCSTVIPFDDTIPQKTEGTEVVTVSITPTNASNILVINAFASWEASAAADSIAAIFQDATANALCANCGSVAGTNAVGNNFISHKMVAGTTSSTTFKLNIGADATATLYVNANNGGTRRFGGVGLAYIEVYEVKV